MQSQLLSLVVEGPTPGGAYVLKCVVAGQDVVIASSTLPWSLPDAVQHFASRLGSAMAAGG